MAKVVIDGKEYDTDELSDNANAQLTALQFVIGELNRLNSQIAALQTARNAYAKALSEAIDQK